MENLRYEYNDKLNILTLTPGVSARDIESLELADGCSIVFDCDNEERGKVFSLSGDLLKAIGEKAQHVEIRKGVTFEYLAPQSGDIWGNLSELRTLRMSNNVGVPKNIDGTGAFQNHPTLRAVEMRLSAEGQLSDNFCRGTELSSFMVHSDEPGKEFGLKAGDNVLFGSLMESEKGISTADWNKIHGKQICKTHNDNAYLSELGKFSAAIEEGLSVLAETEVMPKKGEEGKSLLDTVGAHSYLAPIFREAANLVYTEEELKNLEGEELTEKDYARLLPEAKKVLRELKNDINNDLLGTYMEKKYSVPLIEKALQNCSFQSQKDFQEAHTEAKFREAAYQEEIRRDKNLAGSLGKKLEQDITKLRSIIKPNSNAQLGSESRRIADIFSEVLTKGEKDNKEYAKALRELSDIVNNSKIISNKEEAKKAVRNVSDSYGLLYSTELRIKVLEEQKKEHARNGRTYIELPSRLWAGDNFLSCRNTEFHSSTDPDRRAFKEETEVFAQKTVNAIYAACVEYKESFWKAGLKDIINAQGGVVDGRTYGDFLKEKSPIEAYNKVATPDKMVNKDILEARGTETILNAFNANDRKQMEEVFNFVLKTSKTPPKKYGEAERDMDQQICSIVQGGDIGFEELRKILPSLDLTPDGHVIDFEQAELMRGTKNLLILGTGSKLGDNCLCFTNNNGVFVGHNNNEYRHFKSWAEGKYLESKKEIEPVMKKLLGIQMGAEEDKDTKEAGALRDDIKSNIVALKNEMKRAPSEGSIKSTEEGEAQAKPRKTKEEFLEEVQEWEAFLESYEEYTSDRLVWEANDTEEKWLSNNSYVLQDVNDRIKEFENANSTRKTKDYNTYEDVYEMNRDSLSDELRIKYDALLAEKNEILENPEEVVTGSHFLSEGKEMGNEKTLITGGEINAGHNSFANNPEIIELHKNNPETNITKDVMGKNIYNKSDIFRGRMLMAKEMLKEVFDGRHFRHMRMEEACLDIIVNLFKIFFNLSSWAAKTIEREIRDTKTRNGIYDRNVNEAKEIFLTCTDTKGEAFLERLTSKTSPISEYKAVMRVVGRLNLAKIINSNMSNGKKLEQIQTLAQNKLINSVNAKKRADALTSRDQKEKALRLGFYKQMGTWSREKGMIVISKRLGRATSLNGRG